MRKPTGRLKGQTRPTAGAAPVRVGISACLLGQPVRYDGRDKRQAFLVELGRHVEWVPVCPEVEVGMGVPREPIGLVQLGNGSLALRAASGADWTRRMARFAARRVVALGRQRLAGYVFKSRSPSCGLGGVPVTSLSDARVGESAGRFAAVLAARLPHLPVVEEDGLARSDALDHFLERVHAHARLARLWAGRYTPARLIAFHRAHELLLLAHPTARTDFARLLARAGRLPRVRLRPLYDAAFSATLARPATRAGHLRALARVGLALPPSHRPDFAAAVLAYRGGSATWHELAAAFRDLAAGHPGGELYFSPYPAALLERLRG